MGEGLVFLPMLLSERQPWLRSKLSLSLLLSIAFSLSHSICLSPFPSISLSLSTSLPLNHSLSPTHLHLPSYPLPHPSPTVSKFVPSTLTETRVSYRTHTTQKVIAFPRPLHPHYTALTRTLVPMTMPFNSFSLSLLRPLAVFILHDVTWPITF